MVLPQAAGLLQSESTRRYSFRDQIPKLRLINWSWLFGSKGRSAQLYRGSVKWRVFSVREGNGSGRGFHGCTTFGIAAASRGGVSGGGSKVAQLLVRGWIGVDDLPSRWRCHLFCVLRSLSAKRAVAFSGGAGCARLHREDLCREHDKLEQADFCSRKTALLAPDDESAPAINTFSLSSTKNPTAWLGVSFAPDPVRAPVLRDLEADPPD